MISGERESKIFIPSLRGYEYNLTVENIQKGDKKVEVIHEDKDRFSLETREVSAQSEDNSSVRYNFNNNNSEIPNENRVANITEISENRFELQGSFLTGSSTCSEVGLSDFKVKSQSLYITLVASQSKHNTPVLCTDDISPSSYQITVSHGDKIRDLKFSINRPYGDEYYRNFDV